jgi:hypothetical protein
MTNTYAMVDGMGFEAKSCGRCGGSGKYSFNQIDGDRCYGCGGTGIVRTKRGTAAYVMYVESQKRPLLDLKVGEYLWDDTFGYKAKWLPITEIDLSGLHTGTCNGVPYMLLTTKRGGHGVFANSIVRSIRDEAHRQELKAAALAYQDTLGVNGKPIKRAAKVAA